MKALIVDGQVAGASGDMFLSALLDLFYSEENNLEEIKKESSSIINDISQAILKGLQLKDEVELAININKLHKSAMTGIYLDIAIKEPHRHLHYTEAIELVTAISENLRLSKKGKEFSKKAFQILFEAEAKAHGEAIEKVHLHEAGSLDTFLDVVGVAYLFDRLGIFDSLIYILPINLGSGTVTFSHGTLPVPAPAVEEVIKKYKIAAHMGKENGELFTPTAAIIVASLLEVCHTKIAKNCPAIFIDRVGIGFGKKHLEDSPNALRLIEGTTVESEYPQEEISIIETNIDDCSGEIIGYLSTRLLELGAKDVYLTPIYMKKGRPGTKISVLCKPEDELKFSLEILFQTSTIGVRINRSSKIMLTRKIEQFEVEIQGKKWTVNGKIAFDENENIIHFKPEFEDIKRITEETGLSIIEVNSLVRDKMNKKMNR